MLKELNRGLSRSRAPQRLSMHMRQIALTSSQPLARPQPWMLRLAKSCAVNPSGPDMEDDSDSMDGEMMAADAIPRLGTLHSTVDVACMYLDLVLAGRRKPSERLAIGEGEATGSVV